MKAPYTSTLNSAIHNENLRKVRKIHVGRNDAITIFQNSEGAIGLTIAIEGTDNSLVHFYRKGVNRSYPEKLYRSECLYSRRENFEYQDWLFRTITDEFTESTETLEQLLRKA